jgi:hypothetical protein
MSPTPAVRSAGRFWFLGILTALAALLGVSAPAHRAGAASAMPKVEEILDRAVEAEGGKAAYAALQTRVLYGTMIIGGVGVKAQLTEYAARPNKAYTMINSDAIGKIESGTDGVIAWENSSMGGPKTKEGVEKASALREAAFDGLVNWRQLYSKVECLGVDSVLGKACYRVVLIPAEGAPDTSFFSLDSGLLVLTRTSAESEMGKVPVAAFAEDYRKVDGILMPFKMRQVVMGGLQEMTVVVDSIRHNVQLADDRFAPPADVRALLEKQKADASKDKATDKPAEKTPETGK